MTSRGAYNAGNANRIVTNAQWVVCFACGLRHTARPAGDCPRCHAPSATVPDEPSGSGWRPPTITRPHPVVRPARKGRGLLVFLLAVAAAAAAAVWLARNSPAFRRLFARAVETEGPSLTRVRGPGWAFDVPPDAWFASPRRPWTTDPRAGVVFEKALIRPDGPAVAFLFSAKVPANGFDLDAATDAISRETAKGMTNYRVLDAAPLPGRGGTRVLHVTATLDGEDLEALCLLVPSPPAFYELMVGAPPAVFAARRAEFQAILESFHGEASPAASAPL